MKIPRILFFTTLLSLAAAALASAAPRSKPFYTKPEPREPKAADYVQVRGQHILAPGGDRLHLRGINLGNWLLPEGYLLKLKAAGSPRQIENVVAELIGDLPAARFWNEWRAHYVTAADINYIKRTGLNSVRVPLNWRLFVTESYPHKLEGPGWKLLDDVVGWCRTEGLYVIIDLHGAPGGQTGDNIDDSRGRPLLFTDPEAQQLTIDLWRALALRYRHETIVAGYDLLNEPIPHFFDTAKLNPELAPFYRRLVAAIREVDPHHVIILGGAQWNTNLAAAGAPFAPNLVYSFHTYWTDSNEGALYHYLAFQKEHDVPLYLGESGENKDAWVADFRQLLDAKEIGWCFWPYKKMVSTSCMVTVAAPAGWDQVRAYAEAPRGTYNDIRKALPPVADLAPAAFAELLKNIRLENTAENAGYLKALGLKSDEPVTTRK